MRVLVVSNYRSFHTVRPEAEIFIGLAKKGLEVYVMTYPDSEYVPLFQSAGIQVIPFHPEKKFDKKEIQTIRQVLVDKQIDVLHLFNSKAIINGIQAAKGLPVKVVTYRGYTGNIHWYDPSMYFKYLHPRVDAIQCNSVGVADLFKKQLFFNKEKAFAINKGHKTAWYEHEQAKDVRAEFGIPANAHVLINVANNRRMKGIPYLLKAMNLLPESFHLVLVGRDMDSPSNRKLLSEGASKRVHFVGFRTDALSLVAGSDAFVLSSIEGESITKAVIEAMSLGIPPIITDIPGNVELVEDGISGIRVTAKDADALTRGILSCFESESKRKSIGTAAKNHINTKLKTESTVDHVLAMYQQLTRKN